MNPAVTSRSTSLLGLAPDSHTAGPSPSPVSANCWVCESGANPSRLVDRLVTAGFIERATSASDRRHVTLTRTTAGRQLAERVRPVQYGLNDALEEMLAGQPIAPTLSTLRAVADRFPAGETVRRRREVPAS